MMPPALCAPRLRLALALPVLLVLFFSPAAGGAAAKGKGKATSAGQAALAEIDRLAEEEQKVQQAYDKAVELIGEARRAGDEPLLTRALVKAVELRTGLAGFETAVRFLRDEEWPKGEEPRAVLDLYYGAALVNYLQAYRWEIQNRERTVGTETVDLKAWTREQIAAEAIAAYARAWGARQRLGLRKVAEWKDFLSPNDYPANVRGTLRDAVSYLFAELLADSSLWTPAQSNGVWRLDRKELLADGPKADLPAWLADPAVHPLAKMAAVLGDLEAWHRDAGRPAAELEARLERLRRLYGNFDSKADRALLRDDLTARLPRYRAVSWWSMGIATLADWTRNQSAADRPRALVEARELALAGVAAYPDSPGGAACRRIAREIEAPDLSLAAMASDGAGRRSIRVVHANLTAVYFRAYRLDVEGWIAHGGEMPLLDASDPFSAYLGRKTALAWKVDLPPTPDFRSHATYVVPPLDEPGAYVILASAREGFGLSGNRRLGVRMVIGDLVLASRGIADGFLNVAALDGATGRALSGVEVRLYRRSYQDEDSLAATATSDAEGRVRFREPAAEGGALGDPEVDPGLSRHFYLFGRHGASFAFDDLGWVAPPGDAPENASTLLYTDRAIYRPGQTIYWKALAWRGEREEGDLRLEPGIELKIALTDPNGQEAASTTVVTNEYGTAAAEFAIPAGRPLGAWSIQARVGDEPRGNVSIQVEEYKRPTFEVTLDPPGEALRLNRPATFRGKAVYLFGLPVTGATVRWQVTREPVYPWWWGAWGFRGPQGGASERIASGEAALDADGGFTAKFTPEADEGASRDLSYRFRLSAEVTDEGGETREADRAYRVGFVAIEARIDDRPGFLSADEPSTLGVSRADLDGAPRAGSGSWRLVELEQPDRPLLPSEEPLRPAPGVTPPADAYSTPGDALRPRWEPGYDPDRAMFGWVAGAEVAHGELSHGEDGEAEIALPPLRPGAYRLIYSTVDEFGESAEARRELIVAARPDAYEAPGAGGRIALPALLRAERTTVRVGESAHLLVHSGFPGQEMLLEVWQSGRLRERRRLVAAESPTRIDRRLTAADRGGLLFRLFVLRDHQAIEQEVAIAVPWDDKRVEVELSTFRDRIRPGERETWRVTVREPKGTDAGDDSRAPVAAAELLASMYDRSLDAFVEYRPPAPLDLFPNRAVGSYNASTSLGSNSAWQLSDEKFVVLPDVRTFRPDQLLGLSAYGIGGPGRRGGGIFRMGAMAKAVPAPAAAAAAEDLVVPEAPKLEALAAFDGAPPPPPPPPPGPGEGGAASAPVVPRTNFVETAFWQPHLLTGADGSAAIEFTVPDSLTSWSVWVHALTRDFRSGSVERQTRSARDLMVRPYLPRFLREGDRAEIRAVVNNAGEAALEGEVRFALEDPAGGESRLAEFGLTPEQAVRRFEVEPGGGATVVFPIVVPKRIGEVAFELVARAGGLSDGERRALPVLPGRLHLAQSRFAALRGNETRTLTFEDLAAPASDPTRISDQMVVTLDAQLFYGVLDALPYLIDYPYECTEQTLNRFVSTGIVRSLFDRYPGVGEMAAQLAKRDTLYEAWNTDDPNRRMALEETPWLLTARGGEVPGEGDRALIKVLDPKIAGSQRDASLAKLREAQLPNGAFPWWPGGPPSDYMTVYLLLGFARAMEFGVEVPRDLVETGWRYLGGRYREEWERELKKKGGCCIELLTLLNYVASAYPDPSWMAGALDPADRARIADRSFAHWRGHSPYLKGLLALTLHRMGRKADAQLVWDSVMDSAKTTRDEGTFWQPEERSWLWYNDTIESHAFALRTLLELRPDDPRLPGLVQWIFLQKKLGHWQSTRSTAEVLYSLAAYLKKENQLGAREAVSVSVAGVPEGSRRFVFEPDRYTGKHNQIVIPGAAIDAASAASKGGGEVTVAQETPGLMFASATWHFATDQLPKKASGDLFHVERRYFRRHRGGAEVTLEPLAEGMKLRVGDEIEIQLSIGSRAPAEYVHLRDPRAAGFEPGIVRSGYAYDLGLIRYEQTRDAATDFFFEWLPAGEYTLKYRLRANVAGTFRVGPATLQSLYAPEFVAYSSGAEVEVAGE